MAALVVHSASFPVAQTAAIAGQRTAAMTSSQATQEKASHAGRLD
jgi:hypothetical protein